MDVFGDVFGGAIQEIHAKSIHKFMPVLGYDLGHLLDALRDPVLDVISEACWDIMSDYFWGIILDTHRDSCLHHLDVDAQLVPRQRMCHHGCSAERISHEFLTTTSCEVPASRDSRHYMWG